MSEPNSGEPQYFEDENGEYEILEGGRKLYSWVREGSPLERKLMKMDEAGPVAFTSPLGLPKKAAADPPLSE
jgi:hypothetical protein